MDAPYHFLKKGQKIDQIVTKRLVTEAILIKIRKKQTKESPKVTLKSLNKRTWKN